MNKIIFTGGLGKDAELSFLPGSGKALLKFSVGVSRGYKKEDGTDWLNCTMFGERAEKITQYLVKGTKVLAEGTLRINKYDAKDGTTKYSTDILINNIEFIGGKKEENQEPAHESYQENEITPIDDSDIPF